jgi:ParB-like chromosome segregation protein Spo0J
MDLHEGEEDMAQTAKKLSIYPTEKLKNSPIHGIRPIGEREIDISLLDTDPTNPGSDQFSKRYKRRGDSIRESFHIIGGPIYPLVVCESTKKPGRYTIVDGHGRGDEAARSPQKTIRVIVFPPLTLEQRICLREVLNAAQEPFDTPLVLKDLQLLARERGLSIRNPNDVKTLLADLPENVRKMEGKLNLLAEWPEQVLDQVGIDDDDSKQIIGFDKIKSLDVVVNAIREQHPRIAREFGGEKLYLQVLELYFQKLFRGGRRSQETTRVAAKLLKELPQDDPLVKRFLKGKVDFGNFESHAKRKISLQSEKEDLVPLCKELNALLTDVDVHNLTSVEKRSLKRTAELVSQVLTEMEPA